MKTNPPLLSAAEALEPAPITQLAHHVPLIQMPAPVRESNVPLSHYLWILRRNLWQILGFILICVAATLIVSVRLTPIYEGVATLDIDHQAPAGIIGEDATRSVLNDAEQFMATQVKLVQSDSVLRPVVRKFNLLEREGLLKDDDPAANAAREDAPIVLKKLRITRPSSTYLLQVSYRATDPKIAAEVANAISQSYIAHTFDLRYKASSSLSTFMEKQLDELRAKMESSTEALLRFERELNVINPEEKTSILSARLLQLNTEYTNAQADRVRKEAEFHAISGPSDEAVLTSPQGDPLRKLVEHQNDLKEKFAQVSAQFGVNHPEYRKMATQIAEVQQQIDRLHANIPERVGIEFGQSRNRESMLSKVVAETKKEFDDLNARSFEYQQLKREAEADKKLYEELVRKIKEAGINASFQNSSIRLADFARPSVKPVFPDLKLNTLLALLFASFLGIGAAVLSDVLDNTVRDGEEMSRSLNVPVVGTLPCVKSWSKRTPDVVVASDAEAPAPIVLDQHATSAFTESIRTLRNNILLADFDRRLRTILVSSPLPSEGKSTIAAHLAVAHAQQGKKTLLVDADLRRPSIHRRFGFTATAGLSSVLLGEVQWAQVLFKPENVPDLDILPAGPPSRRASDLVGSNVADLLEEMSQEYDLVIVDTPPLLGFAEALRISTAVDGVLIVARAGQTNRQAVGSTISTLQRLRVHVVGLVLNEVKRDSGDSYYYHGYYNRYYKADQE